MTDHHVRWCSCNGKHHMFIISFIWLMLNLSVDVPRPCLYMLGSPSRTLLFACGKLAYTHCILILSVRDHLIMLPSWSYLSKIRCIRINITCMIMWYDMVLLCTWYPSCASWHDLHHSTGMAPRSMAPPSWLTLINTIYITWIYTYIARMPWKNKTTIWILPVVIIYKRDHLIHKICNIDHITSHATAKTS